MIRLLSILAIVLLMGAVASTIEVKRVETTHTREWELPEYQQDSIQLIEEQGFRAYADSINFEYGNLEAYKCEQVNSVIGVCKLQLHQNDPSLDYLTNGHPMKCGCYNTNYE